ncbi:hypothetical protein BGZ60DRAFT_426035 [Tricladium varicosporioides]|nr:hypothetical protein BGZ60DRAFT_426035 [Hymenoscyphus varicosporioides]
MGKSRSVTIVLAYLLRQYPNLTVKSALALVRESRPIAEPNDGFMAQLELYKEMGCPRDIDLQIKYQRWVYQKEVDLALAAGMAPDKVRFEDEQTGEEGPIDGNKGKEVELRCRKCRRTLAATPYLAPHVPTVVTSPGSPPTPTHSACTHHFLHPLSWMRPALDQGLLNGRLECPNPKCLAQVGRYAWQAFSLQKGRVDEITKTKVGEGSQGQGSAGVGDGFRVAAVGAGAREGMAGEGVIRLPPGMRGKENL